VYHHDLLLLLRETNECLVENLDGNLAKVANLAENLVEEVEHLVGFHQKKEEHWCYLLE